MIPGAGPWVRGFHVCAGQLGSDRAIAPILLHRARTQPSSIIHQAWARDAQGLGLVLGVLAMSRMRMYGEKGFAKGRNLS